MRLAHVSVGWREEGGGEKESLPQLGVTFPSCFLWEASGPKTTHHFGSFTLLQALTRVQNSGVFLNKEIWFSACESTIKLHGPLTWGLEQLLIGLYELNGDMI